VFRLVGLNLRSMFVRKAATALTVVVVGLVVGVLALASSLATGLTQTFKSTGDERHLIVLRSAARSELESWVRKPAWALISTLPEVDRDGAGRPVATGEAFTVINLGRRGGGSANVIVRGASALSFTLRPEVRLVAGRLFRPGLPEVIASKAMSERFEGLEVGGVVRMRGLDFRVVGTFDAGGTAWDSEIWADVDTLSSAFGRFAGYSSLLLRVSDPAARKRLEARIENDVRLKLKVVDQRTYFDEQTSSAGGLKFLVTVLTIFLSIGACFAAANTMYAAVSHRSREIGTLRALGFSKGAILVAFLVESLALSLVAGGLGVGLTALGLELFAGYSGTMNQGTFAEIAFAFRVTPEIAVRCLVLAAGMGVMGGILPARSAARVPITQALRQI
jgi:ABC-type antimicrobial peptide transport system permease subunit